MQRIRIEDIESRPDSATLLRPLSGPLGTTNLALNYYELAPGDSFAYGFHKHDEQEEVFFILAGRVTFETENGDVVVKAGELIRFGPGEFQQGVNTGKQRVKAIAIGAPRDAETSEILRTCPSCHERTPNVVETVENNTRITRCEICGVETARFS